MWYGKKHCGPYLPESWYGIHRVCSIGAAASHIHQEENSHLQVKVI